MSLHPNCPEGAPFSERSLGKSLVLFRSDGPFIRPASELNPGRLRRRQRRVNLETLNGNALSIFLITYLIMSTTGTDLMLDNLICSGIALTGLELLHRSLDAGCWMLDTGYWSLATGRWMFDTGIRQKA